MLQSYTALGQLPWGSNVKGKWFHIFFRADQDKNTFWDQSGIFAFFYWKILLQNLNFKDTNERTVEEMDAEFNINFEVADLGGFQLLDLIITELKSLMTY